MMGAKHITGKGSYFGPGDDSIAIVVTFILDRQNRYVPARGFELGPVLEQVIELLALRPELGVENPSLVSRI